MTTLPEELREFINSLNELELTPVDKEHMKGVRFKKKGHIVPNTPEGIIGEQMIEFADNIAANMKNMPKLEKEKKQEIMTKLRELVRFAEAQL